MILNLRVQIWQLLALGDVAKRLKNTRPAVIAQWLDELINDPKFEVLNVAAAGIKRNGQNVLKNSRYY